MQKKDQWLLVFEYISQFKTFIDPYLTDDTSKVTGAKETAIYFMF